MVPIAAVQQVKAKLMLKGKHSHRPDKMVRKKMPDGTERAREEGQAQA